MTDQQKPASGSGEEAFTVTIFASGDGENTAAEAVHHALAAAYRAGHCITWSEPLAAAPEAATPSVDAVPAELTEFASLMVDEVIARTREQLQRGEGLSVEDQLHLLDQLITDRRRAEAATPSAVGGPLFDLLREQHEAMADVMMLRRPSSGPAQREKAEAAIAVWRRVQAYLAEKSSPLEQMVALDEELEAKHPGWMTGEPSAVGGVDRMREALTVILGSGKSGTWASAVEPLVARFDVAANFNGDAVHNAEGSRALAELLRQMAKRLDTAAEYASAALATGETSPDRGRGE